MGTGQWEATGTIPMRLGRCVAWGEAKGITNGWWSLPSRIVALAGSSQGLLGLVGKKDEMTSSIREMSCGQPTSRPQPRHGKGPRLPARWRSSLEF